MLCGALQELE